MKSNIEGNISPAKSFLAGLNSTVPEAHARLNGFGWMARILKQVSALALIVLIAPMTTANLYAQTDDNLPPPPPPPAQQQTTIAPDQGDAAGAPQGQPLNEEQLGQLVAPIALYPDALVAQILAASTYPTEIVEADRWVQAQGNVSPEQLGSAANEQNWDPSVKALVAFPSVLAQMDKNIQWTTDLGNAYYNQPQDVMNAVQAMRSRAQAAGNLHDTQQQTVSEDDGNIAIAPANPDVVYVPAYNPWIVYGAPVAVFPGYYYGPPAGVYFGAGLAIGFGVGIAIGYWSHWGWGWHGWGCNWHGRTVIYNHTTYVTRSTTVINRGWNRAGGPHGYPPGARGAYYRGDYNHGNYHPQGDYRNGAVNHGTQPGYHGHAQSYHGGPQGHAPQSHSNGGGHYTGGHEGGGHAAGHPR